MTPRRNFLEDQTCRFKLFFRLVAKTPTVKELLCTIIVAKLRCELEQGFFIHATEDKFYSLSVSERICVNILPMLSEQKIYGIYDGEGTIVGEIKYLFEKYFRGKYCSLCDITHGNSFRGKQAWRDNLDQIEWLHSDDQTEEMAALTKNRLPVVIRLSQDHYEILLTAHDLAKCKGDYEIFLTVLREKTQE